MAAMRILRYVKETLDFGILFPNGGSSRKFKMICCSDFDWCRDKKDRKSTTGYIFLLWKSSYSVEFKEESTYYVEFKEGISCCTIFMRS